MRIHQTLGSMNRISAGLALLLQLFVAGLPLAEAGHEHHDIAVSEWHSVGSSDQGEGTAEECPLLCNSSLKGALTAPAVALLWGPNTLAADAIARAEVRDTELPLRVSARGPPST